jgi:hypothetical protein
MGTSKDVGTAVELRGRGVRACLDLILNGDGARACVICECDLLFRVADNAAEDDWKV